MSQKLKKPIFVPHAEDFLAGRLPFFQKHPLDFPQNIDPDPDPDPDFGDVSQCKPVKAKIQLDVIPKESTVPVETSDNASHTTEKSLAAFILENPPALEPDEQPVLLEEEHAISAQKSLSAFIQENPPEDFYASTESTLSRVSLNTASQEKTSRRFGDKVLSFIKSIFIPITYDLKRVYSLGKKVLKVLKEVLANDGVVNTLSGLRNFFKEASIIGTLLITGWKIYRSAKKIKSRIDSKVDNAINDLPKPLYYVFRGGYIFLNVVLIVFSVALFAAVVVGAKPIAIFFGMAVGIIKAVQKIVDLSKSITKRRNHLNSEEVDQNRVDGLETKISTKSINLVLSGIALGIGVLCVVGVFGVIPAAIVGVGLSYAFLANNQGSNRMKMFVKNTFKSIGNRIVSFFTGRKIKSVPVKMPKATEADKKAEANLKESVMFSLLGLGILGGISVALLILGAPVWLGIGIGALCAVGFFAVKYHIEKKYPAKEKKEASEKPLEESESEVNDKQKPKKEPALDVCRNKQPQENIKAELLKNVAQEESANVNSQTEYLPKHPTFFNPLPEKPTVKIKDKVKQDYSANFFPKSEDISVEAKTATEMVPEFTSHALLEELPNISAAAAAAA